MKRIISFLLSSLIIGSVAGCGEKPAENIEIIKSDTAWVNEEIAVRDELNKYKYLSLNSCDFGDDIDEIVFTTGREMENQRMVGYANETENILVYRKIPDRNGIETVNVDLHEGIVSDAYTHGGELYYTVFYPYAGKGEIIYRCSLTYENYVIYTFEFQPDSMGECPVEMFKSEGELFALHSYETEDGYEKKLFYLRGTCCTEIVSFTDTQPFSLDIVSVTSEDYLYNVENRQQVNIKYWKVITKENERTFVLYSDDQVVYQYSMPYVTGDSYIVNGENMLLYRIKQSKTTEYKALEVLNTQLNRTEEIDVMTKYGSDSGEYVVFAHGDYSNQDISVIRIDGQKVYINPVEIDAENCLVRLEACREGAAILLENHDGDYRLYKLM